MKKIILILLIIIVILVTVVFLFETFSPTVEKVHIALPNQTIYLKQLTSIGSNYESVISKRSYTPNKPDTLEEYVGWRSGYFFYKIKNDSLFIYGGNWCNASKILIENVKFVNIDNSNIHRDNYQKFGLKLFPPSEEKFFK